MNELIVRMTNLDKDVELLKYDHLNETQIEKKISMKSFLEIVSKLAFERSGYIEITPLKIPKGCIGWNSDGVHQVYVINQPEHVRYVTYDHSTAKKGYKINYPNSIFVVHISKERISSITHFMYDEWQEMETQLYYPAMPNSTLSICLGGVDRQIINGDIIAALERVIYAPYSHASVNNAKGFKSTTKYFEWLSKNHMQKKYLIPYKGKLKDLFGGVN